MRKYCILFWMVMFISSLQADQAPQIYKWTDSNGNVNFSDKPHPGAEEIELPKVQTYSTPKIPVSEQSSESVTGVESEVHVYQKINVVQPVDQTTIRNPQGYVSILIESKPRLRRGDKIQIIFDGSPLNKPQATSVFALQDINRGSHTIAAQIIGASGKVLNTSETISFFMQQPRVGMGVGSP